MSVAFKWYPKTSAQNCELIWSLVKQPVKCDEIRFCFVSTHVGMDNIFNGSLFARFVYIDTAGKAKSVTPKLTVMVGDQSLPSKFTIQGTIKFDKPVDIQANRQIVLSMGPFPLVENGEATVTVSQKWCSIVYYLQGNEMLD